MTTYLRKGQRVGLRPLEIEDAERCVRWVHDPELTATLLLGRYPVNKVAEQEWIRGRSGPGSELVLGACRLEDEQLIGVCGLHGIETVDRFAELGLFLDSAHQGVGYGGEVIELLLAHAFEALNLHRVELAVFDFNERGLRCYRRLGFVEEGRARQKRFKQGRYCDEILLSMLRSEWRAARAADAAEAAEGS